MIHELKTWPEYYQSVADGSKPFEVRNDDRRFAVGDVLLLREYEPITEQYTGNTLRRRVTYVLRGGPWVAAGYVVLGLAALDA